MIEETALSTETLYSARPIIEIDGQVEEMISELFTGMEMHEEEGGMCSLQLNFSNSAEVTNVGMDFAFEYSDIDLLSLGRRIKVLAGDENDPKEIFRGLITAIEMGIEENEQPELVVFAEDYLQKARMKRHTRLHESGNLQSIVESIAVECNLRLMSTGIKINVGEQMQLNESNLAFLRRLLARYSADMQVVGDELHVAPFEQVKRSEIGLEVNSQLIRVRAMADLAHQVTNVSFSGWDVAYGKTIKVSNEVTYIGPGKGRTGAQILKESIGERCEHIGNCAVANSTEAQELVNAQYAKAARGFVRVEGTAEGNPLIRVGTHVYLNEIGPRFENSYYVTQVCHRFSEHSGYLTDFTAETGYFGG
jgi:phage protein D